VVDGSQLVAPLTRQIGIVQGAATTLKGPLLVWTQIATLLNMSLAGRRMDHARASATGHKDLVYDPALDRAQKRRDSL
jgi:hypothetical protein